ncbi:MAG: hypothetical protein N2444_10965, partial [Methylocystis sp.]|nr:hypothetical protein [Methylocystis sp.]
MRALFHAGLALPVRARRRATLLLLVIFCFLRADPPPAYAGAWLMPEGKGQVILTTSFAEADKVFNAQGRLVNTPPYSKFEARAYWEHGLVDWLTVVGEGSYMNFRGASSRLDYLNQLVAEAKAGLP